MASRRRAGYFPTLLLVVVTATACQAFVLPGVGVSLAHRALPPLRPGHHQSEQRLCHQQRRASATRLRSATYEHFVQIEESSHPLRNRSVRRSVRNFVQCVRDIFSSSRRGSRPEAAGQETEGTAAADSSNKRPSMLRRLVRLAKGDSLLNLLAAVFMLVAAGIEVAVPHYSSEALNAVLLNKGTVEFYSRVRHVLWLGVAAAITTGLRGFCFGLAGTRMVCRLRHELMKSLLRQDIAFYDSNSTGELTNRLSADCNKISNLISLNLNILARQTIQLFGGLAYLYSLHRVMALATGLGLFFIFAVTGVHGVFNRAMGEKTQEVLAKCNAAAGSSMALIRVVRAHASESTELARYDGKLVESVDLMEAHDGGYGLYRLVIRIAQTGLLGVVLLVGYHLVQRGAMTTDQLTSALFYVGFVSSASYDVGDQFSKIQEALGSASYVFDLLERRPSMQVRVTPSSSSHDDPAPLAHAPRSSSSSAIRPALSAFNSTRDLLDPRADIDFEPALLSAASQGGTVEVTGSEVVFSNVSFSYPLRTSVPVLRDLDLHIKAGQRIAIVGASGGGKSTLLRLLCRFYEPNSGRVYVDGKEISSMSQDELTSKVAMLSQEPPLLPISIAANIAYGLKPGTYSMADVEAAARAANIHEWIMSLPDAYNTTVGEGSVALSGGQKQRVAIARALIRKPKVLLLDEATSALDIESEKVVQEALDQASLGRTVLIVAHRLSTIKNAQAIVVLKDGRAVEMGSHEELLDRQGLYASLIAKQAGADFDSHEGGMSAGREDGISHDESTSLEEEALPTASPRPAVPTS